VGVRGLASGGILGSLLGLGGGIIVVPVLTLQLKVDIRYAIRSSFLPPCRCPCRPTRSPLHRARGAFAAYEITEMSMNRFRNFAGEVGYRFGPRYQLRFSVMEVNVTEHDLAGWWSASVDGKGVQGYFRAYEVHADRFWKKGWHAGLNAGYIANSFETVSLSDHLSNRTTTLGVGIGYAHANLFGVPHLYFEFSNPIRFYFDDIPETRLGMATVRPHKVVPNTWLFLGYRF